MKTFELGGALSKLVQLKRITDRGLETELRAAGGFGGLGAISAAGRFFIILWKTISYFNAIGSHFAPVQSYLKELDF